MIASPAGGMDEPARDARNEERVGDLELDGVVDRLLVFVEDGVELGRLGHGTGEAVEDEAAERGEAGASRGEFRGSRRSKR